MLGLSKKPATARGRIGLAFGTGQLALAFVRRTNGTPELEQLRLLPHGEAEGVNGPAAVLRAQGLPAVPVSTVLAPADYQMVLVEAPDVPPAELRAAMRWRLKDSIDFRVEDAVIDVFDVPEQTRRGQGRMMYAVAARRATVERHAGVLAGVAAFDVVDVPELCLRNLAALMPGAAAGIALLHLGEGGAGIVLARGKTFYFARQMDLKAARGERPGGRTDAASAVLELQRSLDYYERHFDQPPITRVVIAPAGARADALAADLRRETGFEVNTLDLNVLLRAATPVTPELQAAGLLAVGAALREERRSL